MFERLFKYPQQQFRDAEWVFESGWSTQLLLICIALVLLMLLIGLWRVGTRLVTDAPVSGDHRVARLLGIGLLQAVFAATLLVMLWRPALKVDAIAQGDNTLALLLDDSRSMYFNDATQTLPEAVAGARNATSETATVVPDSSSRLAQTIDAFGQPGLNKALSDRYQLERIRLGQDAVVVESFEATGNPVENPPVLSQLVDTLKSGRDKSLAGVVIATDGSFPAHTLDAAWWRQLSAYGIPVYPVIAGETALPGEIELSRVTVPRSATPGSNVPVTLTITYDLPVSSATAGEATESANNGDTAATGQNRFVTTLRVFDGSALVLLEDIELIPGQQRLSHIVQLTAARSNPALIVCCLKHTRPTMCSVG